MITMILPYYNQPGMLEFQLKNYLDYTRQIRDCISLVIVDDGSQESPALRVFQRWEQTYRDAEVSMHNAIKLYRIRKDIPWNRGGARNLGSHVATTPWLLHLDIDHVLSMLNASKLIQTPLTPFNWYRFRRFRCGAADETRNKDALPRDEKFGEIKPHGDSYLCTRKLYWHVGGYDEDYSGCLGGGSPFLKQLEQAEQTKLLDVILHVHTRDSVPDASARGLDRDTTEYTKRRRQKETKKNTRAKNPLRFEWEQVF